MGIAACHVTPSLIDIVVVVQAAIPALRCLL